MRPWLHRTYLGDIFNNDELSFEEKRDAIVAVIRDSPWFKGLNFDDDEDFIMTIEELAETDSFEYFDAVWDAVYDWADDNRVWIDVHS